MIVQEDQGSNQRAYRVAARFIGLFLAAFMLFNGLAWLLDWDRASVFAAVAEMDKYEIRSRLLTEAMDAVGVCDTEQAVQVWATGVQQRSAAMQYAVMTKALKARYAADLEKTFPNWVTGLSSPWIETFRILSIRESGEGTAEAQVLFSTATSTGAAQPVMAVLALKREGGFWRIDDVKGGEDLRVYTGFNK